MAVVPEEVKDLTIKQIAQFCGVSEKTAQRWQTGQIVPPTSALIVLRLHRYGDLGVVDPAWAGWVIRRGILCSPENWMCTPGNIRALQLKGAQIAALEREVNELRVELETLQGSAPWLEEQPMPGQWEFKVG